MQEKKQLQRNAQAEKLASKTDIAKSEKLPLSAEEQEQLNREILQAAWNGNNEAALRLMKSGADITAKDMFGRTALFRAAYLGHTRTCAILIIEYAKAGGDIKELIAAKDNDGHTISAHIINQQYPISQRITETAQFLDSMEKLNKDMGNETFNSFLKSFAECIA